MSSVDRESYAQFYREYSDVFIAEREGTVFFELLYSVITDNVELFGDSLKFLLKTENYLRKYLHRVWVKHFGSETVMREVVPKIASILPDTTSDEEGGATLGPLVHESSVLADESMNAAAALVKSEVDALLDPKWRRVLRHVTSLRNAFAHGRVYDFKTLSKFYLTMDGQDSSENLRTLFDAARIYLALWRTET
jgi:hypothetical protein